MKTSTTTGSVERVIRTFGQVAVGAPASYAALVRMVHIAPNLAAQVVGIVSLVVLIATAAQNAMESKGIIPAALRYVPPVDIAHAVKVIQATQAVGKTIQEDLKTYVIPSDPASPATVTTGLVSSAPASSPAPTATAVTPVAADTLPAGLTAEDVPSIGAA